MTMRDAQDPEQSSTDGKEGTWESGRNRSQEGKPFPERADTPAALPDPAFTGAGFQDSLESFLEASRTGMRKIPDLLPLNPRLEVWGPRSQPDAAATQGG